MSSEQAPVSESTRSTHAMLLGGIVGGLVGAVVRGGITMFNLREGAEFGVLASLPSTGIGFLCGAIAGCFCRWGLGAALGALFSAGVFGLFAMPILYLGAMFGFVDEVGGFIWLYFVQKAVAGAIAGGVGGYVGMLTVESEKQGDAMKGDRPDVA